MEIIGSEIEQATFNWSRELKNSILSCQKVLSGDIRVHATGGSHRENQ